MGGYPAVMMYVSYRSASVGGVRMEYMDCNQRIVVGKVTFGSSTFIGKASFIYGNVSITENVHVAPASVIGMYLPPPSQVTLLFSLR